MNNLKTAYDKFEKSHFGLIILIQAVIILLLVIYIVNSNQSPNISSAQENPFSDQITSDAKACLSLSPEERPVCAKMAGVKIAAYTQDDKERLRECLKFRPYYVHDCQLGLGEAQ